MEQLGFTQPITLQLWSCSFMVSCIAFSSWAQRVCASATSSSLKERIAVLENAQPDFSEITLLLRRYATELLTRF